MPIISLYTKITSFVSFNSLRQIALFRYVLTKTISSSKEVSSINFSSNLS
ncbi:hypothetical protein [Malaciobacter mytili]